MSAASTSAATPSKNERGPAASGWRWARLAYPAYVTLILVLLLSPIEQDVVPLGFTWFDKVVHFGLLGGVVVLGWIGGRTAGQTLVHATALAGIAELLQAPLPYRSSDPWDFVAGVLGALAAAVAVTASSTLGGRTIT